jgi:hypothetical protein
MNFIVTRRLLAVAIVAVAIVFTTACSAYRPLSRPPLPRDEVRVSFLSPRNLVGRTEGGTAIRLNAVTELRGSIAAMAPDTMRLFVSSARGPDGEIGGLSGNVMVAVPRDWHPLVQERYTPARPARWVGYAAVAVLAIALLSIGLAVGDSE